MGEIRDDQQLEIKKAWVDRFRADIARRHSGSTPEGVHPRAHQLVTDGMQVQLEELEREIETYETNRTRVNDGSTP